MLLLYVNYMLILKRKSSVQSIEWLCGPGNRERGDRSDSFTIVWKHGTAKSIIYTVAYDSVSARQRN